MMEAVTQPARQLGTCRDYDGLLAIVRQHVEELNVSRETIDYASGTQSGYASKIFAPTPTKRMGPVTLPLILETLGLRLAVEIDSDSFERITARLPKREVSVPMHAVLRANGPHAKSPNLVSMKHLRRIARLGGQAYATKVSPAKRRSLARRAAKARWARVKAAA
jgi:hypothetical protein